MKVQYDDMAVLQNPKAKFIKCCCHFTLWNSWHPFLIPLGVLSMIQVLGMILDEKDIDHLFPYSSNVHQTLYHSQWYKATSIYHCAWLEKMMPKIIIHLNFANRWNWCCNKSRISQSCNVQPCNYCVDTLKNSLLQSIKSWKLHLQLNFPSWFHQL